MYRRTEQKGKSSIFKHRFIQLDFRNHIVGEHHKTENVLFLQIHMEYLKTILSKRHITGEGAKIQSSTTEILKRKYENLGQLEMLAEMQKLITLV